MFLWLDLKLGVSKQFGKFVIRERLIVNLCNALEALSLEGISSRLVTPNGALIDRGEQGSVQIAGSLCDREPVEEFGGHAASDSAQRLILVRERINLAPIFLSRGGLHVVPQFALEINRCGCKCLRALLRRLGWRRRFGLNRAGRL